MEQFLKTETLIIELLLVASMVAIVVRRLRVPYTVALVVVGLLLTSQSPVQLDLTPELILALFVPPLIFEAAFHLNLNELRANLGAILVLAIPGVVVTMLMVGGLISLGTSISLPVALIFGALIAATDPVAVVALFRMLGVPKRLAVLIEGESLLNDGTALVLFNLMVGIAVTGTFDLTSSLLDFVRVSAGGLVIGSIAGWIFSRLIARIDDYLIETTLTTVLAYGAYLLAEQMHFSGVLAVVAAGLINGNLGPQGMSPTTRIVLFNFWEYVAFLVNSLVFLLIGLEVDIPALVNRWQSIAWAIGAVMLARIVVVYLLGWIGKTISQPISMRWRHIQTWGGLRGALSLALALSLPESLGEDRYLLRTLAFGVVLFTLLVQAPTMRLLIRKLGIITRSQAQIDYEIRHARLTALHSAEAHLERRYREGLVSSHAWEILRPKLQQQNALLTDAVRQVLRAEPELETEEMDTARREILRAQRSSYLGLRRDGIISEDVFETLTSETDALLENQEAAFWFLNGDSLLHQGDDGQVIKPDFREMVVLPDSPCDGRRVRHIPWPHDFVIASLRRGNEIIVPRGDTLLQAGDVLVTIADENTFIKARLLCQAQPK